VPPVEKQTRLDFDIQSEEKFGPSMTKDDFKDDRNFADFATPEYGPYEDAEVPAAHMPAIDDVHDIDTYEHFVDAHPRVPICDNIRNGKVMRHSRGIDVTVKGCTNANAMLDTRTY
jgi:hypothetical protein